MGQYDSVTGTNAGDFAQTNTCTATLAPNASCSISAEFTPSVVAPEQATLQVTDNAAGSRQSALVLRTGIATTPGVSIFPPTVDFGTAMEGATLATKTIQMMNSGTSRLHVSMISVGGSNPGDLSQTNSCVGKTAVATQGSCTITLKFVATAQGQRSASLLESGSRAAALRTKMGCDCILGQAGAQHAAPLLDEC